MAVARHAGCCSKGATTSWPSTLRDRMVEAAGGERFEEAAQLRDAMRTVQTLRERQQKVATAQLGDRDVFGLEGRAERRRHPGVRDARRARRRAASSWSTDRRRAWPAATPTCCRPRCEQFYELRSAAGGDQPADASIEDVRGAGGLAVGARRAAGEDARAAARRQARRSWSWPRATRSCRTARGSTRSTAAHFDALETLRRVLGLPAMPRRIECFDISTIQGSETVASMVVCEDGRMKRSEYRKFRIRGRRASAAGSRQSGVRTRRLRRHARGRAAALSQGARAGRAVPGPDPDRRRQGPAVGGLRGARSGSGSANLVAVGIAKKEELLFTRDRAGADRPARERSGAAASCSGSATKRTASR